MQNKIETIDVKHIFIDIVGYTFNRSVEAQSDLILILNLIVKEALKEKKIKDESVIFIPTGDGMCISLLNISKPYDIHIQISLKILEKLHLHNQKENDKMRQFNLRIGVNENIDNRIIDINGQNNISGSGINNAARIESLCDQSQILIGASVFEKLSLREKYMGSFVSFTAKVKHGIPLDVHQYKNDKLKYLNNEIPSKFRTIKKQEIIISPFQAHYMAHCIVNEELIERELINPQAKYSLLVLIYQLAEDSLIKSLATRTKPRPVQKVRRNLNDQYDYLNSIDFWIIADLSSFMIEESLNEIYKYFNEGFLFVSDSGKNSLLKDQGKICLEFKIT